MTRPTLEQVTDFGDYTYGKELREFLKQSNTNNNLSDVRLSPDGRHVHVILRQPNAGLLTFDKYETPPLIPNQKHLDLRVTRTSPIVDLIYLDHNNNRNADVITLVVVYENGKAEFWRFQECKAGWLLLQTSDLCNSPRARVVSVCSCANLIIWCEERPPSECAPSVSGGATRNPFRYCVCQRAYEVVEEGGVALGGVKLALHNSPRFSVISSGDHVYLLPAAARQPEPLASASRCLVSWAPRRDAFRVCSACRGALLPKKDVPSASSSSRPKETDFKRLMTDCLGYLASLEPPEIRGFSPAPCGGLLLWLSSGWVTLLQSDGALRRIYRLPGEQPAATAALRPGSLRAYGDTLALAAGRTLYLVDLRCGRELGRIALTEDALLYGHRAERQAPRLLLETGLYAVTRRDEALTPAAAAPGARLVEAVFEEACKYYQRRSLSSTQLTVDKLKTAGMFQAPISLAAILQDYLRGGGGGRGQKGGVGERSNGAPPGAGGEGQDKLLGSLEAELQALVSLEEVKATLVRAGEKEVEATCESLVQQEVSRLLNASEADGEALLYLNAVFGRFPQQAWRAAQAALQLYGNGSGTLSSKAGPEAWKTVLGPGPARSPPTGQTANGQQPRRRPGDRKEPPALGPLPVFELLCSAVLRYRPAWLPGFLELAHQKQGAGGLSASLASSAWGCYSSSGRGAVGGENGESAVPLYKRALSVLRFQGPGDDGGGGDPEQKRELEVELLLVSGRPNAVLQALRLLMERRQWERVTAVAQRFCQQSPLLNKEIFASLLCEVAQHRDLDPYLDLLWALCPEDLTVTTILNLVLKTVPAHNNPSSSCSSSPSSSLLSPSPARQTSPFPQPGSAELTVGLLKPLLRKVLQRESKPSQRYADILQSPVFPPPAPPRQPAGVAEKRRSDDPETDPAPPAGPATPSPLTEDPRSDTRSQASWLDV